ncbi:MAG TPA: NAD(P)/FAD-dependent oxidoreductase [Candidatus Eisenbacteria bacterium]|nr:NAD(P)/FAD-dependent oxidoreductase [Candidatus Eisenbacteria bacterium]
MPIWPIFDEIPSIESPEIETRSRQCKIAQIENRYVVDLLQEITKNAFLINVMQRFDALVIGAGHNGLTAAAYLAKAGMKVLVLERRHVLGGAAVTEELYPGFKYSVCSYVVSLLRPEVIRELELTRYDLEIIPLDSTFTPMPDGNYLARWGDHAKTRREIARHSLRDAEAYDDYGKLMVEMAMAVKPLLGIVPPKPASWQPREILRCAGLGNHFAGLGEKRLYALAKLMTMSSADFLDEWFETDVLKATMAASGIIGTFMGPRSPGTAYVLLHHYMGELDGAFRSWGFARGGMGSISRAIADAARHHGADIRLQAPVARVLVRNGSAYGVVLDSGEEIHGDIVVSSADPKRTFLKLLGPGDLDPAFLQQVKNYKLRGSSAKVNLALDALPRFTSLPGDGPHLSGAISISPSIDYLERAYDDAKYGDFSRRPYLDVIIPSTLDPSMAPPGKHVMSIFVQYAPYRLCSGSWPERREELGDAVVATLSEYAPGLEDRILHRQVVTPWDLEQEFGLTEGNIFHGELTLDQLFFLRPFPGWAQYRTPIENLFLCGSGTHPGGGVMAASGRLAALEIIKHKKRGRIRRESL